MSVGSTADRDRLVWRARLAVSSLGLAALAFWQLPGWIVPDTKLDLTADPIGLLARSLHLWDPSASFGQLQNQAYGYLFPMGPFFAAGDVVGAPEWAVQRAWWSVVLIVAFLGTVRLAGALRLGTPLTRVLAGFAFALAPRILSSLGAVSVEAWPTAVAPWVLLPLVRAAAGGSPRRNAAWSALALACVGGVNAAATAAAVTPSLLWLLFVPGWQRRWRFAAWWFPLMAVATMWWWLPVLLLGQYSPPFLDWIEDASITSQLTSPIEVLRGSDHWLSYLGGPAGPQWPAGWLLTHEPILIIDTVLLAAIGLGGLARRDMPGRRPLLAGVVVGLVVVTSAYMGPASGPLSEAARSLLDGPLAPLRNVHKFDVMVRLPLVLGLAHALAVIRVRGLSRRYVRALAASIAAVALLGTATPALAGRLPQPGSYGEIPAYWHDAARWLDDNTNTGRALLVPGASFGEYTWGGPRDEPLQALTDRTRWAVRDAVPLSSAGNIRMLDAIETRLASGEGGPGVVDALERSGVTHLVVRNDLNRRGTGAPRPALVHQAIGDLPGVTRVAAFGPEVGTADDPALSSDGRLDPLYPAVEVFTLPGAETGDHRIRTYPLAGTVRMSGGPESLLTAGDAGVVDGRAVFLSGDGAGVPDPDPVPVITDGLRRRAVWFGSVRDNHTEVLEADDDGPLDRRARDYLPWDDVARETVAEVDGVADVVASSAGSTPTATAARSAANSPWAAVDGSLATSWVSGTYGEAEGEWLEVLLHEPITVDQVEVAFLSDLPVTAGVTRARVTTDAGSVDTVVEPGGDLQRLAVPAGPTGRIRVTVSGIEAGNATVAGIRELRIPGVAVNRSLRAPSVQPDDLGGPATAPVMVFAAADGRRSDCVRAAETTRCHETLGRPGEEDGILSRRVTVAKGAAYAVEASVRPRPGEGLEQLIPDAPGGIVVTASSRAVDDPRGRPQAAADRAPGTGWISATTDSAPTLTLRWGEKRTVRGLVLTVDPSLAASPPRRVTVRAGDDVFDLGVVGGEVDFPRPVRTDELDVEITDVDGVIDSQAAFGLTAMLPAGVSEIAVMGADDLRHAVDPTARTALACGYGPPLSVDGRQIPTRVEGTVGDLLSDGSLAVYPCDGEERVRLSEGSHELALEGTDRTIPDTVTLRPASGPTEPVAPAAARVVGWGATEREVQMAERTAPMVVALTENANPGWRASLGGEDLAPVRVDGWAQGFVVPAGAVGRMQITFAPDAVYRAALASGPLGLVIVLALALAGRHRAAPPATWSQGRAEAVARSLPRTWFTMMAGSAALIVMGGRAGLVAAAIGAVAAVAGRLWPPIARLVPVGATVPVVAAGAIVAAAPWPTSDPGLHSPVAQAFALVAVALALSAVETVRSGRHHAGVAVSRSEHGPTASADVPSGDRTPTRVEA